MARLKFLVVALGALLVFGLAQPAADAVRYYDVPMSQVCWDGTCSSTYQRNQWLAHWCHRSDYNVHWDVYGVDVGFTVDYQYRYFDGSGWVHKYKLYEWFVGWDPTLGGTYVGTTYRKCSWGY
jgi:hypothetical protein